jgi:hypothetical protein
MKRLLGALCISVFASACGAASDTGPQPSGERAAVAEPAVQSAHQVGALSSQKTSARKRSRAIVPEGAILQTKALAGDRAAAKQLFDQYSEFWRNTSPNASYVTDSVEVLRNRALAGDRAAAEQLYERHLASSGMAGSAAPAEIADCETDCWWYWFFCSVACGAGAPICAAACVGGYAVCIGACGGGGGGGGGTGGGPGDECHDCGDGRIVCPPQVCP